MMTSRQAEPVRKYERKKSTPFAYKNGVADHGGDDTRLTKIFILMCQSLWNAERGIMR